MKNLILLFVLLSCIFIAGCIFGNAVSNLIQLPAEWSDAQVAAYFASIPNILELAVSLKDRGIHWGSDALNLTLFTDTFATPNRTLGQGYGNCNDFAALFLNYCVMEKKADEVIQYLALNLQGKQWHYYSTIRDGDKWYHQSNISVIETSTTEEVAMYWMSKGYMQIFKWKHHKIDR